MDKLKPGYLSIKEMQREATANAAKKGFTPDIDGSDVVQRVVDRVLMQGDGGKSLTYDGNIVLLAEEIDRLRKLLRVYVPLGMLAMIASEVGEAVEAVRMGDDQGLELEMADILLRCGHFAGLTGMDLQAATIEKAARNRQRPFKHGGKKA